MATTGKEVQQRQKNPVAEMKIWSEVLQKEKSSQKIYENFTINPRKLFAYPDKPQNNVIIQNTIKGKKSGNPFIDIEMNSRYSQNESPQLESELLKKLSSVTMSPKNKFKYPQTSTQELGWHLEARSQSPRNNRFNYPVKKCAETKYANDYFRNQRFSPFSNKNK